MGISYHISIGIERAIKELKKGNNIFTGTPTEALRALTEARAKGQTLYCGCDNVDDEGKCAGHPPKCKEGFNHEWNKCQGDICTSDMHNVHCAHCGVHEFI